VLVWTLVCCLCPLACSADADNYLTLLGRWETGSCRGIVVQNDLVYFGAGPRLEVADISDPYLPMKLGGVLLPASVRDVDVHGHLAYVADSYFGLQIVDVTMPDHPVIVGSCPLMHLATAVCVQGPYAYVVDTYEGLRIIDVSDPADPWVVSIHDEVGFPQDVAVRGDIAYLATWDGLEIIDVSDPVHPVQVGLIPPGVYYGFESVMFDGDQAYFACGQGGLHVYDVTDLLQPQLLDTHYVYGHSANVDVTGDLAVVATRGSGMSVIDISDPANLVELSFCEEVTGTYSVSCEGGFAYVSSSIRGLCIYDLKNPADPQEAAFYRTGGGGNGLVVRDDVAYVAESWAGLRTIDVSEPADPTPVGLGLAVDHLEDIDLAGDHAYLASSSGVRAFDVSDPAAPLQVGMHTVADGASDIAARDNFAAYISYHEGLVILDVTDPTSPLIHSQLDVEQPFQVVFGDEYLFLAFAGEWGNDGGLYILDHTVPGVPTVVGFLDLTKATHVALHGDWAYVFGRDDDHGHGLLVVDIADPTNPLTVGFREYNWPITSIHAVDDFVYLAVSYQLILEAIDVSDPTNPFAAASFERPGYHTFCIYAREDLVYTNGVWIFRNELLTPVAPDLTPRASRLAQNRPNPFNPSTQIRYELTAPAVTTLRIFDLAGRLVAVLVEGEAMSAGTHAATWTGRDTQQRAMPSGTYFYRFEAGGFVDTRRMTLIR